MIDWVLIFIPIETIIMYSLAGLFIAFFAGNQYRHWTGVEPEKPDNPPRHYTTFGRFYFFGFVYVSAFISLFVILFFLPASIIKELEKITGNGNSWINHFEALADPRLIFAAFFITTASTKIPLFDKWEKSIRRRLKLPRFCGHLEKHVMTCMEVSNGSEAQELQPRVQA
jgi:hypothetical protein